MVFTTMAKLLLPPLEQQQLRTFLVSVWKDTSKNTELNDTHAHFWTKLLNTSLCEISSGTCTVRWWGIWLEAKRDYL